MLTKLGIECWIDTIGIWDNETVGDFFEIITISIVYLFMIVWSSILDLISLPLELIALIVYKMYKNHKRKESEMRYEKRN